MMTRFSERVNISITFSVGNFINDSLLTTRIREVASYKPNKNYKWPCFLLLKKSRESLLDPAVAGTLHMVYTYICWGVGGSLGGRHLNTSDSFSAQLLQKRMNFTLSEEASRFCSTRPIRHTYTFTMCSCRKPKLPAGSLGTNFG